MGWGEVRASLGEGRFSMAGERTEGGFLEDDEVVLERKAGLPAEFVRLSTVTEVMDELRRREFIALAMGVSWDMPSTLRALT